MQPVKATGQPPATVKGFAKPVRNYVINTQADTNVDQTRFVRLNKTGARIDVDLDKLSKPARKASIKAIADILDQLKTGGVT